MSLRSLNERMAAIGRDLADVSAVFLTHEHTDHIRGAGPLTKKYDLPLYGTQGTLDCMEKHLPPGARWNTLRREDEVTLGDLRVEAYPTPHDGRESVAFVVHYGEKRLGHATDLGCVDMTVLEKMRHCDALLVESNHDPKLLSAGPYPWPLKKRVGGDRGHLSNQACAGLLHQVKHERLQTVVLMHLSEVNNRLDLVERHARQGLEGCSARLHISRQEAPTPLFSLA
ncbi:MAG: MBL fold metallo-hydrolase [Nitrospina sp.]|nr:MBL fold metallo-hydrolase [Nitrospina sp.]